MVCGGTLSLVYHGSFSILQLWEGERDCLCSAVVYPALHTKICALESCSGTWPHAFPKVLCTFFHVEDAIKWGWGELFTYERLQKSLKNDRPSVGFSKATCFFVGKTSRRERRTQLLHPTTETSQAAMMQTQRRMHLWPLQRYSTQTGKQELMMAVLGAELHHVQRLSGLLAGVGLEGKIHPDAEFGKYLHCGFELSAEIPEWKAVANLS